MFKRVFRNLEEGVMVTFLGGMVLIMIVQIFFRYVMGMSLSWSEEITRYLFVWSAFMSVSFCIKRSINIRIDFVSKLLSRKGRAVAKMITLAVEFAFFAYMIPYAYRYLVSTIESHQVSPACGIPMYLVQSAPLVCFALSLVRIVENGCLQRYNFIHDEEYHSFEEMKAGESSRN